MMVEVVGYDIGKNGDETVVTIAQSNPHDNAVDVTAVLTGETAKMFIENQRQKELIKELTDALGAAIAQAENHLAAFGDEHYAKSSTLKLTESKNVLFKAQSIMGKGWCHE